MKIYLAGQNGAHSIIPAVHGEGEDMIMFLAGGVSGNLKPAWQRTAKRHDMSLKAFTEELENAGFLAGGESRHFLHEVASPIKEKVSTHKPFILESFFYADADTERLLPLFGDFLLDSGAFTFLSDNKTHLDWNAYIERYAAFIVRNNIEKYFELDIDSVVGYEKVKEYRKTLERLTGRPCIPVWHKNRGMKEWIKMCDEYNYVAIGGIVIKEIKPEQYRAFPSMIAEAHKRGAKVHGLGFTNLTLLPKIHFDSVDSTAWTTGNRFGFIYRFDGRTMKKIDCPIGKRLGDSRKVALINYVEWLKFQQYAYINL